MLLRKVAVVGAAALTMMAGIVGLAQAAAPAQAAQAAPATPGPTGDPNGPTGRADSMRTGWYSNQSNLGPGLVSGSTFGQLFSTPVNGQVYAQPLLVNGTVLIATESDWLYGLDPVTGTVRWSRSIGSAWNPIELGCGDLTPSVGITSTPTVDPATGIAYMIAKSYLSGTSGPVGYFVHAVDPATGAEQPNFPVQVQGPAQNNPLLTFDAQHELQRPGLLLLGDAVYAAFGAHCDVKPYQGWVAGISTAGQLTTMWTTVGQGTGSGGGIWQAGGGLVSDGAGQILFTSGNNASPAAPTLGSTPPSGLGESVVRLVVQSDGSLKPTDFFSPYDNQALDAADLDFGSGAPVALL